MEEAAKRNLVFGIQDAVVTTLGFLAGAVSAKFGEQVDVKAAFLTVVVSSVSMAIGAYQGERSADVADADRLVLAVGAGVMLVAYFITGSALILTFKFKRRFWMPVVVALLLLGVSGVVVAEKPDKAFNVVETVALGLLGVGLGFTAGKLI